MSAREWIAVISIVLGELCVLTAIIGVFRFDYVLNRMHATTIADTMGTLLIFVGVMVLFGLQWVTLKLIVIVALQWTTCPVAGHIIARMVYFSQTKDLGRHAEFTFDREEEEETP